jgi:6-methylsalicylate decarboxylase
MKQGNFLADPVTCAQATRAATSVSRRQFTQSLTALATSHFALTGLVFAQSPDTAGAAKSRRIDVHHHILPPEYVAAVGEKVIGAPAPNREMPKWDVSKSIEAMDRNGVASAVVSVSAPGVLLDDPAKTSRLARACNEFAAQMVADYPARYGMFACLPLLDTSASLVELNYALDVLHAEGIVLMSNYRDRYLGDPGFAPIFDELHRRKAVVYVHPTTCGCNVEVLPDNPAALIEFPHDSTRTITSLLFSGTFSRCPDIRFIFPHAGGTLPFLANRIARIASQDRRLAAKTPEGAMPVFKRLYYDTAASANPMSFGALMQLVTAKNVLLGTDFPFIPESGMKATIASLHQLGLDEAAVRAIEGENAAAVFPRLGAAS